MFKIEGKTVAEVACVAVAGAGPFVSWARPQADMGYFDLGQAVLQGLVVFLGMRFVSRISPAEALAMGYFYSFVRPVAGLLQSRFDLRVNDVVRERHPGDTQLEIRLPRSLGVLAADDHDGLGRHLERVQTSSYGGFIGGAIGYLVFVRWKRLPPGAVADATMIGLLVAFTIGRIGCTLTHDHVGAATDFWLGTDYPRVELARRGILDSFPGAGAVVRAHNLGMHELLYLVPLNALVLALAFGRGRRLPAGAIAVVIALAYVPLRFALEELRLDQSDPRWAGLTFAQWASIGALAAAAVAAAAIRRGGARAALPRKAAAGRRSS
jgi:hypothetical protein